MSGAQAASQVWKNQTNTIGHTVPGTVDATQMVPLGTIREFYDANYGFGEFIYLKGVASTVAGDPVTYTGAFQTTRAVAGASVPIPLAFATGATVASTWGWYQISGNALTNKTKTVSLAAGVGVAISTTGLVITSSSLKEIQGAYVAYVASATTTTLYGDKVTLTINRPHLQGRIT
jgi:hypothetical protein